MTRGRSSGLSCLPVPARHDHRFRTKLDVPATINGGTGNDTLTAGDLDDIDSVVTFNGDEGTADALNVDDSDDGGNDTYTVTATQVIRAAGTVTVNHDTAELLTVNTGGGNDTVNVTAAVAGTPVVVNGGTGNDIFNVGTVADNSLKNIHAAVTLNGDGQTATGDRLNVEDQGDAGPRTYTLTATSLTWGGTGSINFATVEDVVLNASDRARHHRGQCRRGRCRRRDQWRNRQRHHLGRRWVAR